MGMLKKTVMIRSLDRSVIEVPVHTRHRDGTLTVTAPDGYGAPLLRIDASEVVPNEVHLKAEIGWGQEWTGSHYKRTNGIGRHVQVMEHRVGVNCHGPGFRGCPIGSGSTVEAAVLDFMIRSRDEWNGTEPLNRTMIKVVETVDLRDHNPGE
jgi:hypothetical protein